MIKIVIVITIIIDDQNYNDHTHYKPMIKIVMIMLIMNDDQNCNDHAHYK